MYHNSLYTHARRDWGLGASVRGAARQGARRAEARAELSVELAQARILPAYELGR